jgi:hypothetical protein
MNATRVFIPKRLTYSFKDLPEGPSRLHYCFTKNFMCVPPLNFAESHSKPGEMHIFMRSGMEIEVIYLISFRVMWSNDSVTSATDVFLSVSDHKSSFNSTLFKSPAQTTKSV